jgi:excisionase family DNA binding protein
MIKNEFILSPLTMEELKTEISEAVLQQLSPLINSLTPTQPETELLTRKEVAKLYGVSLPTILDWTKTGKLIGYRIASRVRYKRSEIEKSLSKIKTE